MRPILCVVLAALATSCVTSNDLARLQDAQATFEDAVARALADTEKTAAEKLEEVAEANDERMDVTEEVARDALERTEEFIKNTGSVDWRELLASLAASGLATVYGVNKLRDGRRRQRGEPVFPGDTVPPRQG